MSDRRETRARRAIASAPVGSAGSTPVHRTVKEGPVSLAVVEALAEAKDVSPVEVERPLYDAVDPDAIDRLFENGIDGGRVVFTASGYEVTVTGHGDIYVRETA